MTSLQDRETAGGLPAASRTEPGAGRARFVVAAHGPAAGADLLWSAIRRQVARGTPTVRHAGAAGPWQPPRSDGLRGARAVTTVGTEATLRAIEGAMEAGAARVVAIDLALIGDGDGLRPSDGRALAEPLARLRRRYPEVDVQVLGVWGDERPAAEMIGVLRAPQPVHDVMTDRALARVFGRDLTSLGTFLTTLRGGLPADTRLALRGSAVSGRSYETQALFDARGPGTSDLDIVAIGEAAGRLWVDEARLLGGINSLPLSDKSRWVAPALDPARTQAQAVVARPVSVQSMAEWFLQLRAAVQGTPYLLLDPP